MIIFLIPTSYMGHFNDSRSASSEVPAIAGAAVGGSIVFAIIILVACFVRRARSKKSIAQVSNGRVFNEPNVSIQHVLTATELDPKAIKLGPQIGSGNYGAIYLALLTVS